jgi:hypothetical protein
VKTLYLFLIGVRSDEPSSQDHSNRAWNSESNSQNRRSIDPSKFDEKAVKDYYSSGWKSAKGGWVGDFGPDHTRASYTGPEKSLNKLSSRDTGDEYIRDEMLYRMAKDIHSSPSKSEGDNAMYEEKRETFPDLESESSMSLDPAVAGAGAGGLGSGMFDNSGVGSDDSNDHRLLSKLQESLSLKSITGSKYE